MGKKRKLIAYPQKYGAKFAAHPANRADTPRATETITEEATIEEVSTTPVEAETPKNRR